MSESSISSDDKLTHTDVLLGRGVGTNRRAGNIYFREVVSQHVEEYLISTKTHKMEITRSVIDRIHALSPPGRFMEKDEVSDRWRECEMKRAHEKTAQALRDGAKQWRTSKRQISSDAMIHAQLSRPAKKQRKDDGVNFDDVSVDAAEPVVKDNLPMKEEEEEEDMEALITGLYSPIFSSATSVDSAAVSPPCPISPCPSANSGVSQVNRKDSFDATFGGLPFHIVDCNCQDQENNEFDIFPLEDTVSLDGMVDMQDEDIFHLWLTC
ncbi:hypothetical protein QTG54_004907 [Skeletonema marinoi]|uniref:DUF6824 domain-containing protein n=1 Tax=Skeletonema marinoi TaxID=267567 RepID=A0AAD9DG58_9STRA|nr:hypothetical protein QTG54_004904 [Skeletonema marinoi]KAK1744373.1 hypothetical protein QTG54_004906 [Skeletonema marinoi]KAK1744374.1 hypothetical protein QTG54_004907 [Skeletonema marinoi]|mmetsp:Transcript_2716/g.4399  ORF Transcript_2716/g.4399 Transcript_2716/m.4399 type:complete len:267 (-) Transcript_2716:146-946(-)